MEVCITEKFALLNILRALGTTIGKNDSADGEAVVDAQPPAPSPQTGQTNPLERVILKHEAVSNRVRRKG